MKTKKIQKKLNLKKKTITNLDHLAMEEVKGGEEPLVTVDHLCIQRTHLPCATEGLDYCITDPIFC